MFNYFIDYTSIELELDIDNERYLKFFLLSLINNIKSLIQFYIKVDQMYLELSEILKKQILFLTKIMVNIYLTKSNPFIFICILFICFFN